MYSGFSNGGYDDRWECLRCTYLNNEDFLCCEICLSVKRSNDDIIYVSDNYNQPKRRKKEKVNVNISPCPRVNFTNTRPFPEFMMINEYPLENGSSIKIITNILTPIQLASFNSFYNRCLLIDEAKGDGQHDEACNQGVLGFWKPKLYSHQSELQPFKTGGHPYLITNTSTMVNGGANSIEENGVGYKIIRSHKPTGFFLTDVAMEHKKLKVYIKPKYAGQTCMEPQNMQHELLDILETVSQISNLDFNGILINVYPDGNVNINAHSDSEGRRSSIATLSFGAERKFVIREKDGNFKKTFITNPNQLIIMQGRNFQADYTHEITKDPNCKEVRVSLTFRNHEIREEY